MYSLLLQLFALNTSTVRLLRHGCLFLSLILALAAFPPTARAVTPAPDGGYPNGNTAEGDGALFSLTSGPYNTAIGFQALFLNSGGDRNTASGVGALHENTTGFSNTATGVNALWHNTTIGSFAGQRNTATGDSALFNNTTGSANAAYGFNALFSNQTGGGNTAVGSNALEKNVANGNTATGAGALQANTSGDGNTANGYIALSSNTTGINNTATGRDALRNNQTGNNNTAIGYFALTQNSPTTPPTPPLSGNGNTAIGANALTFNINGSENTAVGDGALASIRSGVSNTAIGAFALSKSNTPYGENTAVGGSALGKNVGGVDNTAIGYNALGNIAGSLGGTNGDNNIAIGASAGINLTMASDNNIDIGNVGVAGEVGKIRIGTAGRQTSAFIAGIYNVSEGGTIKPVYINSSGRLGTQPPASSRRFKTDIKPMAKGSEALLALKPVTFQYKGDEERTPQFGLIAEDVAKVNPDLVLRDDNGEIYTVRYEAVNAMLLNEFLKEHRKVQDLEKQIAALTATIQKVSDQIALGKPARQLVVNP